MKPDSPKRARSFKAAASMTGYPEGWIAKAKAAGVDAFTANGTIDIKKVSAWIREHQSELEAAVDDLPLREQKLSEEIRKLRLSNDLKSGTLVELSWVHERFQRLGGEVHAIRARSEAEDPVKFAATAGDVALCRTIMRVIWDDVLTQFQETAKHFEK